MRIVPATTPPPRPLDLVVLGGVHARMSPVAATTLCAYLTKVHPEVIVFSGQLVPDSTGTKTTSAQREVLRALVRLSTAGTRIYHLLDPAALAAARPVAHRAGNWYLRTELVLRFGTRRYWFRPTTARAAVIGPPWQLLRAWYSRRAERQRSPPYQAVIGGPGEQPRLQAGSPAHYHPGDWETHRTCLEVRDGHWQLHTTTALATPIPAPPWTRRLAERPEVHLLQLLGVGLAGS